MRIYQWDTYPEPCDQTYTLTYNGDAPDGGCYVDCGYCKQEFNTKDKDSCPYCGGDMIFPRCDW